jgi:hypothetical protein
LEPGRDRRKNGFEPDRRHTFDTDVTLVLDPAVAHLVAVRLAVDVTANLRRGSAPAGNQTRGRPRSPLPPLAAQVSILKQFFFVTNAPGEQANVFFPGKQSGASLRLKFD